MALTCTKDRCAAARPEACRTCNARRMKSLFADTKTVSIRDPFTGRQASNVRVYWDDGSFEDYPITSEDR